MADATKRPGRSKTNTGSADKAGPKRSRRPLEERLPPGAVVHHNPHPKPFKPEIEVLPGTDVLELIGRGRDDDRVNPDGFVGATIVDLTMTFGPDVTPVPGHPCAEIVPLHTHEIHGRSNSIVRFSIHTGTHIDAPYHFDPHGRTMDQVPLDQLLRPAVLCDLRARAAPQRPFTRADLQAAGLLPGTLRGCIPVLYSGWSAEHYRAADFYTHNPYLDPDVAAWLKEEGVAALAIDFAVDPAEPYPCHQVLLGAGIPLIENLIGLDRLDRREFTLIAFPTKIGGGNGGQARVAAVYT